MFGIAVFHWLSGIHYVYKSIFKFTNSEAETSTKTYSDARKEFLNEYDRTNPITSQAANREFFLFIKSKPILLNLTFRQTHEKFKDPCRHCKSIEQHRLARKNHRVYARNKGQQNPRLSAGSKGKHPCGR